MQPLKIVCDENIAYAQEAFSTIGEVTLSPGRTISREMLMDKDILITRSITQVNKALLDGTSVKFAGTATIGTDHVDIEWLEEQGIGFTDAKGCNADAVAEYVLSVISRILAEQKRNFSDTSIGIVGHGNIGSRVERLAKAAGMLPFLNDPPKAIMSGGTGYVSLKEALACDIITFHTPLEKESDFPTWHLLHEGMIQYIRPGTIIINASRGEVTDSRTLHRLYHEKKAVIILDVWENEPFPDPDMLQICRFASPHTAGYSARGKVNGTAMVYTNACEFFGLQPSWKVVYPEAPKIKLPPSSDEITPAYLYSVTRLLDHLDEDTSLMKKLIPLDMEKRGNAFDLLRKNYRLRFEFRDYTSPDPFLRYLGFGAPQS
ncbi:MAG: 4-phosphoerythronate dehydrogenase [Ignavibacteriales bacterium]|nr:MAG: 4-phosphoerythronate dehydrogenase [Ignavibacteriales bacterium]